MINRRFMLLASLGTVALAAAGSIAPLRAAPKNTLVIVTQKTNELANISLRELKRLYTGEQVVGPNGSPIIALNHVSGSPTRVAFDKLVLKMDPDACGRFWIDRKIRGQTGAPKSVPSVEVLRRAVATVANTLTYLNASDVTPELKVLSVEGKSLAAPDYALHYE